MENNNNSGTKSAEDILKLEKELEQEANVAMNEARKPSEDEDEIPEKVEEKVEEDEDEDDEDGDIDDEDIDEDDEEDEGEIDEDDKHPKSKDKEKAVPAWMVKMQERRLQQEIARAREEARKEFEKEHGRKPDADEKKELDSNLVDDFKEEFGIEPDENTKKFLQFLEKRQPKLSPEFTERMAKIEQANIEKLEEIGFEKDFSQQKPLIDKYFPKLDDKALNRIKTKVKELAYTEKYAKYSLDDIIRLNRKALTPVERKRTGEPSKGGAGQARYTVDNIDADKIDWDSLSIEEAEKAMASLEKNQGKTSRLKVYRKGRAIN